MTPKVIQFVQECLGESDTINIKKYYMLLVGYAFGMWMNTVSPVEKSAVCNVAHDGGRNKKRSLFIIKLYISFLEKLKSEFITFRRVKI